MNLYELYPTKELKKLKEDKTYVTENLINSLHINMPSTFGDYPIKELELELRCYLPTVNDGVTEYSEYMGYQIDVTQKVAEIPITNDITGAVQIVKVMIIATKDGNVIGKTNFVDKQIYDAPLKGDPLTPREQFDTVIAEQRETIEEQGQTITEQQGTITEQGEQITELNGEVTELTTENTRLEALTDTQRETIQNMIDNPPQPKLYTPPVVTPSGNVQQINPPTGYDGLSNAVVDRVTAEVDSDIQPENIKEGVDILGVEGTYNPFPYNSYGGIYITKMADNNYPSQYVIVNYSQSPFPIFFTKTLESKRTLASVIFNNCNISDLADDFFRDMTYLEEVVFPVGLLQIKAFMFSGCVALRELIVPNTVTFFGNYAFNNCVSLYKIFIPNSITSVGLNYFNNCLNLEDVTLESGFNCNNFNLSSSTKYSHDTILSWFNALADRTGETAYTLTIGTTNLNKMTAEEKAIATNKNWNLA